MPETQIAPTGWKEAHGANSGPATASQGGGHRSDEQLAHAAGRGDTAAFDALYQRHHQPLLAFARHMLGRMHDAEDVVQHTFLAADRAFRAHKVPKAVRAWLYTVARNRCVSLLRARRDEVALGGDECVSTDGLAAEVEQREELRALVADLRRLPDDQRAALLLSELGELTHIEVARVIGVRQGKVKALVFQAREALAAASHARSLPCRSIREELSVATGAGLRRRHLRDHLTQCEGCRGFSEQVHAQRAALAIVLPVVPSVGLHEAIVGGAAAAAGAGAAGAAGAGAAGAGALSAGSVAAKLLTIAAVGGTAAGGGALGLTELHPGRGDRPAVARTAPPAPRAAAPSAAAVAGTQSAVAHGRAHAVGPRSDANGRRPSARRPAALRRADARPATRGGQTDEDGGRSAPGEAKQLKTKTPKASTPPGQAKKQAAKTPPGQAKKQAAKTPPGHAKKQATKTPPGQAKQQAAKTPPGQAEQSPAPTTPPGKAKQPAANTPPDKAKQLAANTPPGQAKKQAAVTPPVQPAPSPVQATPPAPAATAPGQAKKLAAPAADPS